MGGWTTPMTSSTTVDGLKLPTKRTSSLLYQMAQTTMVETVDPGMQADAALLPCQ